MKRLFVLVSVCMMLTLAGCGCANDTNNDGITGNDKPVEDNRNDMAQDDNRNDNLNETGVGTQSGRALKSAADGLGNAAEDIGRGADNVMRDMSNATRDMVR